MSIIPLVILAMFGPVMSGVMGLRRVKLLTPSRYYLS